MMVYGIIDHIKFFNDHRREAGYWSDRRYASPRNNRSSYSLSRRSLRRAITALKAKIALALARATGSSAQIDKRMKWFIVIHFSRLKNEQLIPDEFHLIVYLYLLCLVTFP